MGGDRCAAGEPERDREKGVPLLDECWIMVATPTVIYATRATRTESGEYAEIKDSHRVDLVTPGSMWNTLHDHTTEGWRCRVLSQADLITVYKEQIDCFRNLVALARAEARTRKAGKPS